MATLALEQSRFFVTLFSLQLADFMGSVLENAAEWKSCRN
jgi:hypothetical protein